MKNVNTSSAILIKYLRSLKSSESGTYYKALKRGTDILLSLLLLILLSPLLFLTAILIRLDSRGPILFRQSRVGLKGRLFRMLKFRSMGPDASLRQLELNSQNEKQGGMFKILNDPRITRVGKLIRRYSIDELPQLINVLKGDMSLVGPRPILPEQVPFLKGDALKKLSVSQGLTCIWQVSGRSNLNFEQQIEMDLLYVRKRSFLLDLQLLILTIPAVILARGAC